MITQETAERIWQCYREISAGEKLISDMAELRERYRFDEHAQKFKDAFGRMQGLQLGIPSGKNSHRLFDVSPELAKSVIKAHIANKKAALTEANEQARMEVGLP